MSEDISIVIPCYNHNREVVVAAESALSQQQPCEVIVVDDGSDPPIENIWGGRVRLIVHEKNRGLSAALNTGIEAAAGHRIVVLAADDELHPAHTAMLSEKDADIVSCNMVANGKQVRARPGDLDLLMRGNCHSYAALFHKALWRRVGGFKETMNPSWEDYEFWLNCAKHGATWDHVDAPLHKYNRTMTGRDAQAQGKDILLRAKLEGYHQDVFGTGRGVVCFVIPCYNHEEFLPDAIGSAQEQIYPHVRVVVVDDGSPGNVDGVVRRFKNVDIVKKKNGGLASARNAGIRHAIREFNPQFLVMLDADDKVAPEYVEHTLSNMKLECEYIYTDLYHFSGGEAPLVRQEMKKFNPSTILHQLPHPCTFLMATSAWQDVVEWRGYGYDESEALRIGFEDWEFAVALVESGHRGKRIEEALFYYRQHASGSMRTEANKRKNELFSYIRTMHNTEDIMAGCTTCGGSGRFTSRNPQQVSVKGVGIMDAGQSVLVEYLGSKTSTQMKVAKGGRIYKFSANPNGTFGPRFFAAAGDSNLFQGPFRISPVGGPKQEARPERPPVRPAQRVVENPPPQNWPPVRPAQQQNQPHGGPQRVRPPVQTKPADQPTLQEAIDQVKRGAAVEEGQVEDFRRIKGVGPKAAMKIMKAGYTRISEIANEDEAVLVERLRISETAAEKLKEAAQGV